MLDEIVVFIDVEPFTVTRKLGLLATPFGNS
jgi:hypothetical protein